MRTLYKAILIITTLLSSFVSAQFVVEKEIIEPEMTTTLATEERGGRNMPSIAKDGKYVKVLIVFVQFKDDNYDSTWSAWPKNHPPTNWMGTELIDQTTTQNSTNQNLTHYYTEMSLGNYKIIGDCYHVITPHTRDEYIASGTKRSEINKEVLQTLNNSTNVNFSDYDLWNKSGTYDISWGQDDEVDMIWMVYRNIVQDYPDSLRILKVDSLGFGSLTSGKYSGLAELGNDESLNFTLDGVEIDMGAFGDDLNSGVTIMEGYGGLTRIKNLIIHEYGHQLFGGNNWHLTAGSWGMMGGYGSRGLFVNAYERYILRWIEPLQYDNNPSEAVTLRDYIEYGDVLRIKVPNTVPSRYYYLENHQRTSVFDKIDLTDDGKGIYVLYHSGYANSNAKFHNAEGRFDWNFEHDALHPTEQVLVPVFKKGVPDNTYGDFDTELIWYNHPTLGIQSSVMLAKVNDEGEDEFSPFFRGDGLDMMKPGYVEVMNLVSNPPVEGISFQVIEDDGDLKIIQKVEPETVWELPPSKPQGLSVENSSIDTTIVEEIFPGVESYIQKSVTKSSLSWYQNQENDFDYYKIYRAVTTGSEPSYTFVDTTSSNSIVINNYDIDGDCKKTYYRIKAVDTDGLESVYSEAYLDYARPTKPTITLTRYQGHPKLTWSASCTSGMDYILKKRQPGPDTTIYPNSTTWIDYDVDWPEYHVDNQINYYYKVQKRRTSNLKSKFSAEVKAWEQGTPQTKESANNDNVPTIFALQQNYPNPFNPTTKIKYQLPKESGVQIKLYDMLGREIKEFFNDTQEAGYYELIFDGSDLSSGTYIYRITAGDFTDSKKFLLLK